VITVDLFMGCGGLAKGFQDAGFIIKAAYDNWDAAIECYKANFDHAVIKQDLGNVEEVIPSVQAWNPDIIIGGPPCQDFSHAGKRKEGARADLTVSFAEIVVAIKPKWFLLENVDRITKSDAYADARKLFTEAGYGLTERVLDASLCGVPQKRRRFFCIGLLGEEDGFLNSIIDANLDSKPMTIRDYMGDELDIEYYYRHPRNYNRRGIFSIDEPSPTVRGVNRPVPKGYKGHHGDPVPVTPELRPLTTFERARLQTFPKDFKWIGTKTALEQMIGNAVPVPMAEFVARAILEYDSGMETGCYCERQRSVS